MDKKIIMIVIAVLLICVGLSGCFDNNEENNTINNIPNNVDAITPHITFSEDDFLDTLIIKSIYPSNTLWSNLSISGNCNTSNLGEYITKGETITNCKGNISMLYIPTNEILGYWEFTPTAPRISTSHGWEIGTDLWRTLNIQDTSPFNISWGDTSIIAIHDKWVNLSIANVTYNGVNGTSYTQITIDDFIKNGDKIILLTTSQATEYIEIKIRYNPLNSIALSHIFHIG